MSVKCNVCGKTPSSGNNVSHANNKTKRRWMPNLQKIKIVNNGSAKRVTVCTRCIRSGSIVKAA